jgi:hypothetical protein
VTVLVERSELEAERTDEWRWRWRVAVGCFCGKDDGHVTVYAKGVTRRSALRNANLLLDAWVERIQAGDGP